MKYKEKILKSVQILKEKAERLKGILIEVYQKKQLKLQFRKITQSLKNLLSLYLVNLNKVLKKKEKRCLSIDFGQSLLKITYVETKGTDFKLLNYDLRNISPALENKKEIVNFINNFLKINSIPEKEVYLTISEPDSIVIKHLNLPVIPRQEIEEAAKWQLKNEIPFGLGGGIFDWQIVREYTDEEGIRKNEIAFVALDSQTVDKYLSIVGECNLQLLGISFSPFNYANILR